MGYRTKNYEDFVNILQIEKNNLIHQISELMLEERSEEDGKLLEYLISHLEVTRLQLGNLDLQKKLSDIFHLKSEKYEVSTKDYPDLKIELLDLVSDKIEETANRIDAAFDIYGYVPEREKRIYVSLIMAHYRLINTIEDFETKDIITH